MTDFTIPYPEEVEWEWWAQTVVGFNPSLANQLDASMPWQEFGDRMTLVVPSAPRTDIFDSWQAWASALKLAVSS
jgi:hypothetical protein